MAHEVIRVRGAYLTRAQLAAELGCSERSIVRWEKAGVGPPRTILGLRRILYRREAVLEWLRGRVGVRP
jgi:predicted DNA-binding transcriptional regulator AlpA